VAGLPPPDEPAASPAGRDQPSLAERVQARLAGLDGADLAAHPGAFEALDAAILAELRGLEGL
jgi:hypothetical protein